MITEEHVRVAYELLMWRDQIDDVEKKIADYHPIKKDIGDRMNGYMRNIINQQLREMGVEVA